MAKYRKKPMFVEAYQVTEDFLGPILFGDSPYPEGLQLGSASLYPKNRIINNWHGWVTTIHGQRTKVVIDDWVIDEGDGTHFYPCKPDIFEKTYDLVEN